MKLDVAKHIVEILLDQGMVRIPGFGNFVIINHPAKLSVGKKTITPPSLDVAFTEEEGDSNELELRLKKEYKLKKKEAVDAIDKFSEKLLNSLVNLDRVRIAKLGLISKADDGSLNFSPTKGFVSQFYKGLPEVSTQIEGLVDRAHKKDKTVAGKKKETEKKDDKIAPVIISARLSKDSEIEDQTLESDSELYLGDLLDEEKSLKVEDDILEKEAEIGFSNIDEANKKESQEEDVVESSSYDKIIEKEVVDTEKEIEIQDKVEKEMASTAISSSLSSGAESASNTGAVKQSNEDYVPLADEYEEDKKSSLLWPLLILTLIVLLALLSLRKCSSNSKKLPVVADATEIDAGAGAQGLSDSTNSELLESKSLSDDELVTGSHDGSIDNQYKEPAAVSEDASIEVDPSECIIITGVFRSERNSQRMMKNLKAGGYIPYAENYGDSVRVGFKFDCSDVEDLPEYLRVIRQNISNGAWYLQPEMEVY